MKKNSCIKCLKMSKKKYKNKKSKYVTEEAKKKGEENGKSV